MTVVERDAGGRRIADVMPRALAHLIRGFFMGAADVVPGVSGGTIALIFGIYQQLLDSIRTGAKALGSLLKGDIAAFRQRLGQVDWAFLIPLLIGVLAAVVALSSIIDRLLSERPEEMAGLFFGLVLASVFVAWSLLTERDSTRLLVMVVVAAVVFVLLGFQSGPAANPPALAFFGAGALAICAMILPGISGSFLLLMIGMYSGVIGAVHDRELGKLIIFMVGAVIGLAVFSTLLGWLLDRYRDTLLAVLIGLMFGSLRVLWPWPNGVGVISDEDSEAIDGTGLDLPASFDDFWLPTLLGIVAFAVVGGVSRYATKRGPALL